MRVHGWMLSLGLCGVLGWLVPCSLGQEIAMPLPADELIAPQDKEVLNRQAAEIFKNWDSISGKAGQSTVLIAAGNRQIAQGIVVSKGVILSKLSDLKIPRVPLVVVDSRGKVYDMRPMMSIPEYDLILLDAPGVDVDPIRLDDLADTSEGDMVAAVSAGGHVTDFGVISVDQRSLREEDAPYMGLIADPTWEGKGARIIGVDRGAGAYAAGLREGDILQRLNGLQLEGMFSMRTALKGINPGAVVPFIVEREGKSVQGNLRTTSRPKGAKFPQKRLEMMNSMGNRMSSRRSDFPLVFQSDMTLLPECAGCPVINLEGKIVGLALSRAGRMETYILPAWVVKELVTRILPKIDVARRSHGSEEIPIAEPVDDRQQEARSEDSDAGKTMRAINEMIRRLGYQPKDY